MQRWPAWLMALAAGIAGCGKRGDGSPGTAASAPTESPIAAKVAQYAPVRLTSDLGRLTDKERRMLPLLIGAAATMDTVFRRQIFPGYDSLLTTLPDSSIRRFVEINYGPWDRLDGNAPFVPGVGERPPGVEFYPHEMTKEQLEQAADRSPAAAEALRGQYSVVRRDSSGTLTTVPYHKVYGPEVQHAAAKLREAAALAEDPGLKRYLLLRSQALMTDRYQASDLAWLDMKHNTLDIVIGPIESYADELFGYRTAAEAFVLIKDKEWSSRLARYAALLPALQRGLPVPAAYKREQPGTGSDLNAYDAVFCAGEANAGSKTIAINLPNDEQVQLRKGTRRLQLKNVMRAKFDKILRPIAAELIASDQQTDINFDAFFANVMFHEVAHGLGIKNTIDGKGTVRAALKEQASALEEAKADILGLHLVTQLLQQGELKGTTAEQHYVTYLASIFRSIRFGASDAHGRANAAQLSFFEEHGAFTRDSASGRYRVDLAKMQEAVRALGERILRFQGDGDYEGVKQFMATRGRISPVAQADLGRLRSRGIPVDVVYQQGPAVLGLEH
jgi:Peptidase family M49